MKRESPQPKPGEPKSRGATAAGTTFMQRFQSYREHHRDVALESLGRLAKSPLPTLMTLLVIAIAISLPAGLFVMLKNAEAMSDGWDGNAQISLFLHNEVNPEQGRALASKLANRDDVARTEYISRQQALEEFQQQSGFGDLLQELGENPLPAVVVVYPSLGQLSSAEVLRDELAKSGDVELAQLDAEWVKRLHAMLDLGRRLALSLSTVLALAVLLVIVNTIRLAIESRRDEIVIVEMVGGTDSFVRRPFLYTGVWYGLGGCLLALVMLQGVLWWLHGPVASLSSLYSSEFRLSGLGWKAILTILGGSVLVGLIGSYLAVSQHIRSIEPG